MNDEETLIVKFKTYYKTKRVATTITRPHLHPDQKQEFM